MEKSPVLAIVVPCYKEEAVLHETHKRLSLLLDKLIAERHISQHSYILYVNDGSTDQTWPIIKDLHQNTPYACGLNLAGNVGHQNALMAGLNAVKERCDVAISIDADLQDDVNAIPEMLERYREGCDIVYGVRRERKTDTFFKRTTALTFYKLMKIMGVKSVYNHADYRLMSCRAIQQLCRFRERNLYLRGLVPLIGYQTACVYYNRRQAFCRRVEISIQEDVKLCHRRNHIFFCQTCAHGFLAGLYFYTDSRMRHHLDATRLLLPRHCTRMVISDDFPLAGRWYNIGIPGNCRRIYR